MIRWVAAESGGLNCSDVCKTVERKCDPPSFNEMMDDVLDEEDTYQRAVEIFDSSGLPCSTVKRGRRKYPGPGYNVDGSCVTRHPDTYKHLKKCNGKNGEMRRLCPCKVA